MPYKDKEKQAAFQAAWMRKRREDYIKDKGPCVKCGATENLMLIRKKSFDRFANPHVFSYKGKRRDAALARFELMCKPCGKATMWERLRETHIGKPGEALHLNHDDVWAIRGRLMGKESTRAIGRAYGVHHAAITDIQRGTVWRWLKRGRRRVYEVDYSEENLGGAPKGERWYTVHHEKGGTMLLSAVSEKDAAEKFYKAVQSIVPNLPRERIVRVTKAVLVNWDSRKRR